MGLASKHSHQAAQCYHALNKTHLLLVEVVGQAADEDAVGGVGAADVLLQAGGDGEARPT